MLAPEDVRLLAHLSIGASLAEARPTAAALRRARFRGSGLEFHEFRRYEHGDDPRAIDWTIEARLRQLVVRVARADGHLAVHLLVDTSASMGVGQPSKLSLAARLAATLAYVAVERRDAAGVATFDRAVTQRLEPATGRRALMQTLATLERVLPAGASDLTAALTNYGAAVRGPGLAVVLSDFLAPDFGRTGLEYLAHRGLAPVVVRIFTPEEVEPPFTEAELESAEHPERPRLHVTADAVLAYRSRHEAHVRALDEFCAARGMACLAVSTATRYADQVRALERGGLLRSQG